MNRLFCAIDTGDVESARTLVERLVGTIGRVKLGAAFLLENGLASVDAIASLGLSVWLDLRNHVITPGDALRRGADYLVVGRPITQADDPRDAATRIAEEMASAMG